jgi:hypothetical protein
MDTPQKINRQAVTMLTLMPRHARRKFAKLLHAGKILGLQDSSKPVAAHARPPVLTFAKNVVSDVLNVPEKK